jgi:hypothetical protein
VTSRRCTMLQKRNEGRGNGKRSPRYRWRRPGGAKVAWSSPIEALAPGVRRGGRGGPPCGAAVVGRCGWSVGRGAGRIRSKTEFSRSAI